MSGFAVLFLILNAVALMAVPRRWAILPLLIGACYMTGAQQIVIGPFHFTVIRILIIVGAVRAYSRGDYILGGLNRVDWISIMWGIWLVLSSFFHRPFSDALVFRLGATYNILGIYFLIRVFCQSREELIQLIKITAILLVPVAIEMINEQLTARNVFSLLGGVAEDVMVRDGKLRAQGPFGHPILAGTVGAMCIPLMIGIWRQHANFAKIGLMACMCMVLASKSSGPLMSVFLSAIAICLWKWRRRTKQMRIIAVLGYIILDLMSSRPAYYMLLNRIDLTGSSTGWHRAELINQAINHLNEWWIGGTDYTRHWMPTGVSWSDQHTDITNHYIHYGVWGGLPLTFLFMGSLWVAFKYVGEALRLQEYAPPTEQFFIWCMGAGLFSHAVTCITVAYFDQSVLFLYLNLAAICAVHAMALMNAKNILHETHDT